MQCLRGVYVRRRGGVHRVQLMQQSECGERHGYDWDGIVEASDNYTVKYVPLA